nr:hypothetical protein [Tanacetum cinerariifolium]
MKGYFDKLESLNMVFDAELSINIILSGMPADYNQKATQGKSDCGSKRKVKYEIAPTSDLKEAMCFYCNTKGHWKRSCPKYLKDLKDGKVEKGGHSGMYTIELHNTTTSDSWVLDTGCGTHICDILQGLKESRRLKHRELNLVMGNRKITPVTRIETYELMLKSEVRINLNNCCYSSEMKRNVISLHALFKDGYQFSFDNENGDILVYSNSCFMFKASPCKGIYESVKCISNNGNVIINVGSFNELDKSKLWHSHHGHVNKKHITQLQKDGVLESFDCKSDDDNMVFVARRGAFLEREMISNRTVGVNEGYEISTNIQEMDGDEQAEITRKVKENSETFISKELEKLTRKNDKLMRTNPLLRQGEGIYTPNRGRPSGLG